MTILAKTFLVTHIAIGKVFLRIGTMLFGAKEICMVIRQSHLPFRMAGVAVLRSNYPLFKIKMRLSVATVAYFHLWTGNFIWLVSFFLMACRTVIALFQMNVVFEDEKIVFKSIQVFVTRRAVFHLDRRG
jgi:hypothetical protein